MAKTNPIFFLATILSSGLLLAQAPQETSGRLVGTVTDTAGAELPSTTVWVVPNLLTPAEMGRIESAQKALESAESRLRAEQRKLVLGASVVRFVTKEQQEVAQAESEMAALEVAASSRLLRAERILKTDAAGVFVLERLVPGTYPR